MRRSNSLRTVVALFGLAAMLCVAGCKVTWTQGEQTPGPVTPVETPAPAVDATGTPRPKIADADAAILKLAKEKYPAIPIETATTLAIGKDTKGLWWVQAFTNAGPRYEQEQWFVTWDGDAWKVQDSGTGIDRNAYPGDVTWEDLY